MGRPKIQKKSTDGKKQPSILETLGINISRPALGDLMSEDQLSSKTRLKRHVKTANTTSLNVVPSDEIESDALIPTSPLRPHKIEKTKVTTPSKITKTGPKVGRPKKGALSKITINDDLVVTVARGAKRRAASKTKKIVDEEFDEIMDFDDDVDDDDFDLTQLSNDDRSEIEEDSDDYEDPKLKERRKMKLLPVSKHSKVKKEVSKAPPKTPPKTAKRPKLKKNPDPLLLLVGTEDGVLSDPFERSQLLNGSNPFFGNNESHNSNIRKIGNSLKDKLFHLYGYNQDRLVNIVKLQEKLYYNVVHLSLKEMMALELNEIEGELFFDDCVVSRLTFDEYDEKFPLRNAVDLVCNLDDKVNKLFPGAATFLPDISSTNPRQGFILNTGALPIDMAWSFQTNKQNEEKSRFQYLAVSISNTFNVTDPRFSIFHDGKDIKDTNGLNLYQIDTENLELKLLRSYISHDGLISNLKWVPWNNTDAGVIGVLAAVFADGKVRFLKMNKEEECQFWEFITASKTLEIPETRINSFDFISNESIVFGTQNGFIGEFHIKTEVVKYLYPLLTHGITSITSNFADYYYDKNPKFENGEYVLKNKLVFVGSIDLQFFIDLNDIANQCTECLRSKTLVSLSGYVPLMHLFSVNDGSRVTKVFTKRDSLININILKNEGVSSSLATSRLHPMVMAGSSDGEMLMSDSLKRIFATRKSPLSQNFPTSRIMKLEYSSVKDCFRLITNHLLENVGLKEIDIDFTFNSPNVCINSMVWNENQRNGNWYAASSIGGLIIIEKMLTYTTLNHYNERGDQDSAVTNLNQEIPQN